MAKKNVDDLKKGENVKIGDDLKNEDYLKMQTTVLDNIKNRKNNNCLWILKMG